MQKYKKIYIDAMGYTVADTIFSEISSSVAVDIHHILGRGRGGKDRIENLIALSREEHDEYGDKNKYIAYLMKSHAQQMNIKGIHYDIGYVMEVIKRYED